MRLGSVIGVVFIILKLTHLIGWSWWWVLLPIYGPAALLLIAYMLIGALITNELKK